MGAGQMEINFLHGDPLDLADDVFYFKRSVREAALKHKMYATFMAKPMANEPGSAMHIHQSIVDRKSGRNIFSNIDGSASDAFRHYIGGLQKYLPAAMAFLAPYVNSYRRLVRHSAAPINIRWGRDNRTVGIRVPRSTPENRRVENRVIGADANPYVATAVTLACGYLGMKERIEPSSESTGSAYHSEFELPRSMSDSLHLLGAAPELAAVLGERFVRVYRLVKELEYDEFMKVISSWEREHLLLHV
jgi:glutamine synthetase